MDMLSSAATQFPSSIYDPPSEAAGNASMPSLNLNLAGVNVSLGGPAGTGVYRTSSEVIGVQADGIRDGVRNLFGKVRQGVDRINSGL
jgi:vacuolar protein sorting-associated protein 45